MLIPANGLLVRLPMGRPLGVVLVGGRDTLGESVIRDGGRRRCSCAMEREDFHGWHAGFDGVYRRALRWQNRHKVWVERDIINDRPVAF